MLLRCQVLKPHVFKNGRLGLNHLHKKVDIGCRVIEIELRLLVSFAVTTKTRLFVANLKH